MNSPNDVTNFMVWLYETGSSGDVFETSDGSLIWKPEGEDVSLFLCEKLDVFPEEIKAMS